MKGSRLRCLLATNQPRERVAGFFMSLATQQTVVRADTNWAPRGFPEPGEVRLGQTEGFEGPNNGAIVHWWLANGGNTPNWDLVSHCQIDGQAGLILVEAKAHFTEFGAANDVAGGDDPGNQESIEHALAESNAAWNEIIPGFDLSAKHHYQLSNRFAFAWKLAEMGMPIVLVYLGFLNAWDMQNYNTFSHHNEWRRCVLAGSNGVIPRDVWGQTFHIGENATPVSILIRSAEIGVNATVN